MQFFKVNINCCQDLRPSSPNHLSMMCEDGSEAFTAMIVNYIRVFTNFQASENAILCVYTADTQSIKSEVNLE